MEEGMRTDRGPASDGSRCPDGGEQIKENRQETRKAAAQALVAGRYVAGKLTINMAASPHGAVAFYSELAAWFASFTRYSSSGDDSSGRALWNRAYDAER